VNKLIGLKNLLPPDTGRSLAQHLYDEKVFEGSFQLNLEVNQLQMEFRSTRTNTSYQTYTTFNFDRLKLLISCFPKLSPEMEKKKSVVLSFAMARGIIASKALEINELVVKTVDTNSAIHQCKKLLRTLQTQEHLEYVLQKLNDCS